MLLKCTQCSCVLLPNCLHTFVAVCRIMTRKGVILAAGAWSGSLLGSTTGDTRWHEVFKPRRGHLLELDPPAGMPPLRHGLMEMGYTQVSCIPLCFRFAMCCVWSLMHSKVKGRRALICKLLSLRSYSIKAHPGMVHDGLDGLVRCSIVFTHAQPSCILL